MPIISFKCKKCGEEFEDFRSIADKKEHGFCLACGSLEIERMEVLQVGCDCGCGCSSATGGGGCH